MLRRQPVLLFALLLSWPPPPLLYLLAISFSFLALLD